MVSELVFQAARPSPLVEEMLLIFDFHCWVIKQFKGALFIQPTSRWQLDPGAVGSTCEWDPRPAILSWLRYSSARRIFLDPALPQQDINLWADLAAQTGRQVSMQLPTPSLSWLPEQRHPLAWQMKRWADRLAAAVGLLCLVPVFLAVMGLMQISSPGPFFFRQWRVGHGGRLFRIIKFRTMVPNADQLHHQVMGHQEGLHKRQDDPRITPVGRWMRKYSIDELPQLFNVVLGQMSLVGPRPWAIYDAIRIPASCQHRMLSLPGITGAWQVSARSTQLDLEVVNRMDLQYLGHWSLLKDLSILLQTLPKVATGFGAF